jgi:rod shape determining protein RodA
MQRWIGYFLRLDWLLMFSVLTLTAIGLLAIYGINISRGGDFFQFKKQFLAVAIGLAAALLIARFDYRQLRTLALFIYGGGFLMLVASLVVGRASHGGGRWFIVGALSFQPVELAKIALAIFLASYLARMAHQRLSWTAFVGSGVATGVYVGLTLLQPDFGSAMVLMAIWLAATLFCGLPRHAWWILILSIVTASYLLWNYGLRPYQRDRIASFINPSFDPYGASYNVTQARIAVGSGGVFGKGIGEGSQARLRFLPEASTDFMFAVLGEELGFVGVALVLGFFGLLMWRFVRIGMESDDAFAGILLVSLLAMIAFHLLVNAGMNLGIMPVTGIPLPFLSAAASSVICMFLAVGLAQSVAVHSRKTH